ncbi:MAG TPA: glycoside hydrolase family 3 N-terminal domain-containing protein, partial [Solirubrobacteraceae bacterium]|nr:glycoside hydrolase family 3 N-terminal domain-containing protein [Solirubrobacteraceae bacterium]
AARRRVRRRRLTALLVISATAAAALAIVSLGSSGSRRPAGRAAQHPETAQRPPSRARAIHPRPAAPTAAAHHAERRHGQPPVATSLHRMLGQMIVARFAGPTPPPGLLRRIRAGEVGGVILFADNLAGGPLATRSLTAELQAAARTGHNPRLLIMTDQEGGEVKRLPGPPSLSPSQMNSAGVAFAEGKATGASLRSAGVNVDLAPVADVEHVTNSFLGSRAFAPTAAAVAQRACAFARGLASEGVAYTLKHFPGLGWADGNTDLGEVTVDEPASTLRADYQAYRSCGANPLALVMMSSAIYPTLTGPLPASMSRAAYRHELRVAIPHGSPVTISDDLQTPSMAGRAAPARTAINAGLDLLLYAETDQGAADAYSRLRTAADDGELNLRHVRRASEMIMALKQRVR